MEGGSGALIALGRLSGLLAVLLVLGQVFMISRVRWLERLVGFDGITRYHRTNGKTLIYLLVAHPILLSTGYGIMMGKNPIQQYVTLTLTWPYVIFASVALWLFIILVIMAAVRQVRRRLTYEQWYATHLLMYVAILLSYFHQIPNGADFGSQLFRAYWYGLYMVAFGSLAYFRFVKPIIQTAKHQFKVTRVEKDTPKSTSVYVGGKKMDEFKYRGGQFNMWVFMKKGFPLQKHPFTISAEPNGLEIRLTAKGVGDFTKRLGELKPGTKVFVEGPYGIFTPGLSRNKNILMIAGGAGITPMRAMLPEMLAGGLNIKMLYGNQTTVDTMLKSELDALAKNKNFSYVNILSNEPKAQETGYIDAEKIKRLVPDFMDRDVYLCGPPPMMNILTRILVDLGMPQERIYSERFSL